MGLLQPLGAQDLAWATFSLKKDALEVYFDNPKKFMKTIRMKVANPPKPHPVLLYNGDCSFNRRAAFLLRGVMRKQVDFADSNKAWARFPEVPRSYFKEEVKLITPTGHVYGGAEAVCKALTYGGFWGWLWPIYDHLPPFRWVAELIYTHIEKNRERYSKRVGPFWMDWDSGGTPYEIASGREESTPRVEPPPPVMFR
jgi:predicted DCC family thiol-disulfide oxidoreductase YuxK